MKFRWTNLHTSMLCIVLLLSLGGFMLYLKMRRFRHYIDEDIEQSETTKTQEDMVQANESYDMTVRGYRNNNPLNIRISKNNWKGEIKPSQDGSFCQFDEMANGFRAAMVCIRTYIRKHGCDTLEKIINRWAPWSDGNNPTRYAQRVMNRFPETFPSKDTVIDYTNSDQMTKLVFAMAIVENGSEPVMQDCLIGFLRM